MILQEPFVFYVVFDSNHTPAAPSVRKLDPARDELQRSSDQISAEYTLENIISMSFNKSADSH